MPDQAACVFVTVDIVLPRLASNDGGWEGALIQRKKQPYQGAWALPGGHVNTEDLSLEAAAQREVQEETGLLLPLDLFQQVQIYEDFEDPRGKYVCLLYVLKEPLPADIAVEAGDDASFVQWYSIENLQTLPLLAFNHIRLLRMALRQFFTSYYEAAVGLQPVEPCQCELLSASGKGCSNTAYWRYQGKALCPRHIMPYGRGRDRKNIETASQFHL